MDWEQKAAALNALAEIELKIRKPGDWYVMQTLDVKEEHVMRSVCGNGTTPETAILSHWRQAVDEIGEFYLVARPKGYPRRAVRWNGFMWEDVHEPNREAA